MTDNPKTLKRFIIKALVVLSILLVLGLALFNQHKIKLVFASPDNLKFEDYPGIPYMIDAIKEIFPNGTDMAIVEKSLVESGGAYPWKKPEENLIHFVYSPKYLIPSFPKRKWNITVYYDSNNKVSQILVNGFDVSQPLRKSNVEENVK